MGALERRILGVLIAFGGVVAAGTLGYMILEGWPALDAVYMTVITIGSVGYGEVHPLSPNGRVFTIGLIVAGLGVMGYGLSTVTAFLVEGQLTDALRKRRMERSIAGLRDHVILVGGGETGKHIVEELLKTDTPFVLIERDAGRVASLERLGSILYMLGDATDSAVLEQARIADARGLITTIPLDKDNLFVILCARELNPKIRIISRLTDEQSRSKFIRAGADVVVSENLIGGLRMASEMLRPHVVSFLDAMLRETGSVVRVEEVQIPAGSPWIGKTLAETQIRERVGVVIFGLREAASERYLFNPNPNARLSAGDVLIGCADREQIATLRRLATTRAT
ncbi:MAG: NAD-binding protein [Candidatus Rokubacteria bacterium]|nr:NAD-binding protein [Candidatus Rokubacteria bacterium]MBI2544593.1 NAD-binding protein [Candidatus Rokubacteria bacterium]